MLYCNNMSREVGVINSPTILQYRKLLMSNESAPLQMILPVRHTRFTRYTQYLYTQWPPALYTSPCWASSARTRVRSWLLYCFRRALASALARVSAFLMRRWSFLSKFLRVMCVISTYNKFITVMSSVAPSLKALTALATPPCTHCRPMKAVFGQRAQMVASRHAFLFCVPQWAFLLSTASSDIFLYTGISLWATLCARKVWHGWSSWEGGCSTRAQVARP